MGASMFEKASTIFTMAVYKWPPFSWFGAFSEDFLSFLDFCRDFADFTIFFAH
jgi:hypothetical protein